MKTWSLVFWETEQNEVSLWSKQEQISVAGEWKLLFLLFFEWSWFFWGQWQIVVLDLIKNSLHFDQFLRKQDFLFCHFASQVKPYWRIVFHSMESAFIKRAETWFSHFTSHANILKSRYIYLRSKVTSDMCSCFQNISKLSDFTLKTRKTIWKISDLTFKYLFLFKALTHFILINFSENKS